MRIPNRDLIQRILDFNNIRQIVEDEVKRALRNKCELLSSKDPYPVKPLNVVLETIITQGYRRKNYIKILNGELKKYGKRVGIDDGNLEFNDLDLLIQLSKNLYNKTKGNEWIRIAGALEEFKKALIRAGSLKNWTDILHQRVNRYIEGSIRKWKAHPYFRKIRGLGFKGACDTLRSLGYFDLVPIDIHERRFQIRTGIIYYAPSSLDPKEEKYYVTALREFCKRNLKGVKIFKGIDLGEAPGVVDWIIWYLSCTRTSRYCKGVCTAKPKCNICPIKDMCFYNNLCRS